MTSVNKIFVAGGIPSVTYNQRSMVGLEDAVSLHLDASHTMLAVSGPTKSGKTVLVRRLIPPNSSIWIEGSSVDSIDSFWSQLANKLGVYKTETDFFSAEEVGGSEFSGEGSVGLDSTNVKVSAGSKSDSTVSRGRTSTRNVPLQTRVVEKLNQRKTPVVVDDFHYIKRETQKAIARGIKPCLLEGVPVTVISIPHRSYDAVTAEPEMIGRVRHLKVPLWADDELAEIGRTGFPALNVNVPDQVLRDLATQAAGSPLLMQEFCLRLCLSNGLRSMAKHPETLRLRNEEHFYRACASDFASSTNFLKIIDGLTTRGNERKPIDLVDGGSCDIYRLVLTAILRIPVAEEISYATIRDEVQSLAAIQVKKDRIKHVLKSYGRLAAQAAEEVGQEPVVEWIEDEELLVLVDPLFSFILRWMSRPADL